MSSSKPAPNVIKRQARTRLGLEKKKRLVKPKDSEHRSSRNDIILKMEMILLQWIEENNVAWDARRIQDHALTIFRKLKRDYERVNIVDDDEHKVPTFIASRGWFYNFKKRFNASSQNPGELSREESEKFVHTFRTFVESNAYTPQQVFSFGNTTLRWKRRPANSHRPLKTDKEIAAAKEKVVLFLCGNASGDFKCKPLMIYRKRFSRDPNNDRQTDFPVHYISDIRTQITTGGFQHWFTNIFCPEVEEYSRLANIPFRALLVLSEGSICPPSPDCLDGRVKVVFVPTSLTDSLHPMHVGIVKSFEKAYNELSISSRLGAGIWDNYEIHDAMVVIAQAWNDLGAEPMNTAWKNIWPGGVYVHLVNSEQGKWNDIRQEDLVHPQEEDQSNPLTNSNISIFIDMLRKAGDYIDRIDPNSARTLSVRGELKELIEPYERILEGRKQRGVHLPATCSVTTVVKEEIAVDMDDDKTESKQVE